MNASRKGEPGKSPEVKSVEELLSVARAMEREAAARYQQLAALMEGHRNMRMAALFRDLAEEEREHESGIVRWADRLGCTASAAVEFRWTVPEALDEAALDGAGGPHLLTPYRALCLAVENEERAVAFFIKIAAMAPDPAVRREAESLAKEELGHVTRLRLERRRAYRAERTSGERPPPPAVRTLPELLDAARTLELRAAQGDAAMADALEAVGSDPETVALLRRLADEERQQAGELAARLAETGPAPGEPQAEAAGAAGLGAAGPAAPADALRAALKRAEEGFEFYAAVAEQSTDEAVLRRAQALAETMVGRLALINRRLSEVAPPVGPAA